MFFFVAFDYTASFASLAFDSQVAAHEAGEKWLRESYGEWRGASFITTDSADEAARVLVEFSS